MARFVSEDRESDGGETITPTDMSELLLKERDDPSSAALQDLLDALEKTTLVLEVKVKFDEISESANPTVDDDPSPDPVNEST